MYIDLIEWLIFSGHQFVFSARQYWKSVWTDTPVFENQCEQIHWFSKTGVHWNQVSVYWFDWLGNFQWTWVCFQYTPVFENQCEQIHLFAKTGVDLFDWPVNIQWSPVCFHCTSVLVTQFNEQNYWLGKP